MSLKDDLSLGFKSATKDWRIEKKKVKRMERMSSFGLSRVRYYSPRQTVKDAAFQVMEKAINNASDNGTYKANARQIMYAARPLVLEITGGEIWKDSAYFTQNILKEYLERHGGNKNVIWDARGHITEPHTGKEVPLGGADVEEYINKWSDSFQINDVSLPEEQIKTSGPKNRYGAILFIEKEGFDEILEEAKIGDKYDIAIMSTKGIPVGAASKLLTHLSPNLNGKIFVLHDFDSSGFKIVKTLREGTRLNSGTQVIDLGLRLNDVTGLESETVEYRQRSNPAYYLRQCGATEEECKFLVDTRGNGWGAGWSGQRVELNAILPVSKFIEFIEKKLQENGVTKVIPAEETLRNAYRRATFLQRLQEKIDEIKDEVGEENIDIPEDLTSQVKDSITDSSQSWDEAIWTLAEENKNE